MKCQRCSKIATLHITEVLPDDGHEEFHFCDDCAKLHLYAAQHESSEPVDDPEPATKHCRECGLKFLEFRNSGRLGCEHDYDAFAEELVPLLESIHGEPQHEGKVPHRRKHGDPTGGELTALRKRLQQAIDDESYEEAAGLRDRIRELDAEAR